MRILLVSGTLPPEPCGVGDYTDALARSLARIEGNGVAVLTSGNGAAPASTDYDVLRPVSGWRLSELVAAWAAIRRWRPDIVHVQYPTQGYQGRWLPSLIPAAACLTGAGVVRSWHEPFPRSQWKRFVVQCAAPGPAIVVRPNFEQLMWPPLLPLLKLRRRRLIRGASAIPPTRRSAEEIGELRSRLLRDGRRLLAFFGFLHPLKGAEQLFDIADPATDRLLIVGEDRIDPAYSAKLRTLADGERWAGRARLTGNLPANEIADLLAAADAVVLPFIDGGGTWNSSIHAASLQGTPVVTTHAKGAPGTDNGLVTFVDAGDQDALRKAVEAAPAWSADRIRGGSKDEWTRVADEHMAVYRGLMGGRSREGRR